MRRQEIKKKRVSLMGIHGIHQARILARVAIFFSWGSSQPRD